MPRKRSVESDVAAVSAGGEDAPPGVAGEIERRYKAPALEKGLDILQLLSRARAPMTVAMISTKLGRSPGELFRIVQVLEFKKFIEQSPSGDGFIPTSMLFSLGIDHAPNRTIMEIALPAMRKLSDTIGQSCHLVARSESDIVVIANVEANEPVSLVVRIGHRRAIWEAVSGAVLYAFQSKALRSMWDADMKSTISAERLREFRQRADLIRERGYEFAPSGFTSGVVDISAPVMRRGVAIAALAVPFVHTTYLRAPLEQAITLLRETTESISVALSASDHSPRNVNG